MISPVNGINFKSFQTLNKNINVENNCYGTNVEKSYDDNDIIICNEKSGNTVVYNFKEGLFKDIISNITKKNVLCCVLNENNSL